MLFIKDMVGFQFADHVIKSVFEDFDVDGNGTVERSEMLDLIKRLQDKDDSELQYENSQDF